MRKQNISKYPNTLTWSMQQEEVEAVFFSVTTTRNDIHFVLNKAIIKDARIFLNILIP